MKNQVWSHDKISSERPEAANLHPIIVSDGRQEKLFCIGWNST